MGARVIDSGCVRTAIRKGQKPVRTLRKNGAFEAVSKVYPSEVSSRGKQILESTYDILITKSLFERVRKLQWIKRFQWKF